MSKQQRILQALHDADSPLSTNKVADRAGLDWHTASDILHGLLEEDKVTKRELSNRLTLWWDRDTPL